MKLMVMIFILLSISPTYGAKECDRTEVHKVWGDIKNQSQTQSVNGMLRHLGKLLEHCKTVRGVRSDINQKNIEKFRRLGFMAEYRKELANIQNSQTFNTDKLLDFAKKSNLSTTKVLNTVKTMEDAARQSCGSKDYRDKLPPVRDLSGTGWDFAASAADLMSLEVGQNVSALGMAIDYYRLDKFDNFMLRLGLIDRSSNNLSDFNHMKGSSKSMAKMTKNGLCLEKDLPSEDYKFSEGITNLKEALKVIEANVGANSAAWANSGHTEVTSSDVQRIYPNVNDVSVEATLRESAQSEIHNLLSDYSCQNRIQIPSAMEYSRRKPYGSPDERIQWNKEALDLVSKALDNKIVSVRHDVNLYVWYKSSFSQFRDGTIVGKKWNIDEKRCDFLVRNSFGSNCAYVDPKSASCEEDGHFWVPAAELMSVTTGVGYVQ